MFPKTFLVGAIVLLAIGCRLPLTNTKVEILRSAQVLVSETECDRISNSSDLKFERVVSLQYQGHIFGVLRLHQREILFSSPNTVGPIRVWEYQDYGGYDKITQSKDGKFAFIITKHQLLWATFRVITINLQTSSITSAKISKEKFSEFCNQQ